MLPGGETLQRVAAPPYRPHAVRHIPRHPQRCADPMRCPRRCLPCVAIKVTPAIGGRRTARRARWPCSAAIAGRRSRSAPSFRILQQRAEHVGLSEIARGSPVISFHPTLGGGCAAPQGLADALRNDKKRIWSGLRRAFGQRHRFRWRRWLHEQ